MDEAQIGRAGSDDLMRESVAPGEQMRQTDQSTCGSSTPLDEAWQQRITDWQRADEEIRLASQKAGVAHRFEGAACRAARRIFLSGLPVGQRESLMVALDDAVAQAEYRCSYRIDAGALQYLYVRLGRLLSRRCRRDMRQEQTCVG